MPLDPTTHAIRPDLADVRLAGRVFAPHFAAAIPCRAIRRERLLSRRDDDVGIGWLAAGDVFAVLEIAGGLAWGTAERAGLVGYVDHTALEMDE